MVEKALSLALAIYRITKHWPEGEVLIGQIREVANNIVGHLSAKEEVAAVLQIKVLQNYLQIARSQQWTKEINFVIIENEYNGLMEVIKVQLSQNKEIKRTKKKKKQSTVKHVNKELGVKKKIPLKLSKREEQILSLIKEKKTLTMPEIVVALPKISSRTILRDIQIMLRNNLIKREGRGRGTIYSDCKNVDK